MDVTANGKQARSLMVRKLERKTQCRAPAMKRYLVDSEPGWCMLIAFDIGCSQQPQVTWWPTLDTACSKTGLQLACFATDEDLRSQNVLLALMILLLLRVNSTSL